MYIYPCKVKLIPVPEDIFNSLYRGSFRIPREIDTNKVYTIIGISDHWYIAHHAIALFSREDDIPIWYPIDFCRVVKEERI